MPSSDIRNLSALWFCEKSNSVLDVATNFQVTAVPANVLEVWMKSPWEACTALTFPQAWQWCRLKVRVKSQPQFMHIMTWDTGTSIGGLSPKGIPSLSLSLKWKKNKWRSIHTSKVHCQPCSITYNSLISVYLHLLRSPIFLIPNAFI